jgi:hypothetical protein
MIELYHDMLKRSFFYLFLGVIFVSLIFWAKPADALLGFGGRILSTVSCANGLLVSIGPPRPGLFMWMPSTLTFSWYQLRPGPWALGAYFPGGSCVCPYGNCEVGAVPALGTMTIVGTSQF